MNSAKIRIESARLARRGEKPVSLPAGVVPISGMREGRMPDSEKVSSSVEEDWFEKQQREWLIAKVNTELHLYRNEGNGLNFWAAYALIRDAGEPVPEVILQYLDEMSARLVTADSEKAVAAAVGMGDRKNAGSALKHWKGVTEKLSIVSEVQQLMGLYKKPQITWRVACKCVADRRGLGVEAVRQTYKRWNKVKSSAATKRPANSVFEWGQGS